MPNWCTQKLTVSKTKSESSKKEFKDFEKENIKDIKGNNIKELTFTGLLPMPEEIILNDKEKEIFKNEPNWYIWGVKAWGTKWDAETYKITKNKKELEIQYNTAWDLPIGWLDLIAKKYINLDFKISFFEEGGFFDGYGKTINGKWKLNIQKPGKYVQGMKNEENQ